MITALLLALGPLGLHGCPEPFDLCPAGQRCVCPAGDFCRYACDGPGCLFECQSGARCGFECDAGGCVASCRDARPCDMSCAGGGCSMDCTLGADCEMFDCTDCPVNCDDPSKCDHDDD